MKKLILLFILLNLFLNIFGNNWGLPSRWNSDEKVANVLHMADKKTLVDPTGEFLHPTGYHIFLLAFFAPAYVFLKLIGYPLSALKEAASISWINMAQHFPEFASGIYIYARTLSGILGALCILLIFLLGKRLYDKKTGIFSAAFLSVTMGFVGINHFAKYLSLLNFLIISTLLLCVSCIQATDPKKQRKLLYFSFLLAGLATSAHVNAPLLFIPLCLTVIFTIKGNISKLKAILLCFLFFILGFGIGTPSLLTNLRDYYARFAYKYLVNIVGESTIVYSPQFAGIPNSFLELISVYGIPIFTIICSGLIYTIFKGITKGFKKEEIVVLSFVFTYLFIISFLLKDKYPQIKHILAIVPLLPLFGGRIASILFSNKRISIAIKGCIFLLVFIYSFAYCVKADLFFIKGDTRYTATKWVYDNVPKGSKIELFDQLNFVGSCKIMNDYRIVFLGRDSEEFNGEHFFKWNEIEGREEYLKRLNIVDSSSDYIIIDMHDTDKLYYSSFMFHLPGMAEYLRGLFEGKKNYKLVKKIEPRNKKIKNKNGIIMLENLWWDPVPAYRVTANTIYIFKRIRKDNV